VSALFAGIFALFATSFALPHITATAAVGALPATPFQQPTPCNKTPHILQYRGEWVNIAANGRTSPHIGQTRRSAPTTATAAFWALQATPLQSNNSLVINILRDGRIFF
jgi:hypothetical protein